MAETTYAGLTHTCDDPECHVRGFVTTLAMRPRLNIGTTSAGDTALMVSMPPENAVSMTVVEKCESLDEVWDAVTAALGANEGQRSAEHYRDAMAAPLADPDRLTPLLAAPAQPTEQAEGS